MTRLQEFLAVLRARGVSFEPIGEQLAIEPVEVLKPDELSTIRERKQEILSLLAVGRFERIECPGDGCREFLFVIDGLGYCNRHQVSVRFIEGSQ